MFVPAGHLRPDVEHCIRHCLARGYHVAGVVTDHLEQATEYLQTGEATVLVVADLSHLDPASEPRIEVVSEQPTGEGRRGRRTRIIPRDEEE